jgi:hypothetical protein
MQTQRDHTHGILSRTILLLLLAASATLVVACSDLTSGASTANSRPVTCPVPIPSLIPAPWIPEQTGTVIGIDPDTENECLVVYRYNVTGDGQGPLGAVVFDPQVPGNQISDLMTYRLLPWINHSYSITNTPSGSPMWLLGTIGEKAAESRVYDANGDGKGDELGIVGTDAAGNKTTLSLYRWINRDEGYRLIGYFHGGARVEIVDGPPLNTATQVYTGTVRTVRTVDRLYDRSGLALVYQYERNEQADRFEFRASWYAYVDGQPAKTCYFPEGASLNYYTTMRRPVFELRVISEDDQAGTATVCAGTWELSPNTWRRYWAYVQLDKQRATKPTECDQWIVQRELIDPARISCNP